MMNTLSFKTSDWNGLSFELLIDGKPLAEYVGFEDNMIPYWIAKEGIPVYQWTDERIVAVCNCGEYGCDCVLCNIEEIGDKVIFKDFHRERSENIYKIDFEFSKENFNEIEIKIAVEASKRKD